MRYVVFGASGFLGSHLTARLVGQGHDVLAVARNEGNLIRLYERCNVEIVTGDIADRWTVRAAMRGQVAGVYVLSAAKHADIGEDQVRRTVQTNLIGLMNVLEESFETRPAFVAFTSSDKGAHVRGVYGASKMIGEGLMREAGAINGKTKYITVRYGNVIGSTCSFLEKWRAKAMRGEEITLTDPDATRFLFTVDEAVAFIEAAVASGESGLFCPTMKAARVGDVLDAIHAKYGACPVRRVGLRPWENLHETIDGKLFSGDAARFTVSELMAIC